MHWCGLDRSPPEDVAEFPQRSLLPAVPEEPLEVVHIEFSKKKMGEYFRCDLTMQTILRGKPEPQRRRTVNVVLRKNGDQWIIENPTPAN